MLKFLSPTRHRGGVWAERQEKEKKEEYEFLETRRVFRRAHTQYIQSHHKLNKNISEWEWKFSLEKKKLSNDSTSQIFHIWMPSSVVNF